MTSPHDDNSTQNKESTQMHNLARKPNPTPIKYADNVIGLFPGALPGTTEKKHDVSLIASVARIELNGLEARLASAGIDLIISDDVLTKIAKMDIDQKYGARPLQKIIAEQLEFPISQAVLQSRFVAGETIIVLWKDGVIRFTK